MTELTLQHLRSLATAAAAGCLLATVPACVVVPTVDADPVPPALTGATDDPVAGGGSGGFVNEPGSGRKPIPGAGSPGTDRWWRHFRDPELDSLLELALSANPDLLAVGRRIEQANASLVQAGSTLFPEVDGDGEFRSRWNEDGRRNDDASLGLTLDWELDVWGRIRSGRAARREEVTAAVEDWRAARLILTGAVAETWFDLVEQRGQLRLVGEQIQVNRTLLDLTRLRFGQGQSSVVDVLQQQEQLESTESLVPDIESRIEALELVLDTLTGQLPGKRPRLVAGSDLGTPPPRPGAGYPSELLEERPDLRAQRARIAALDHEVAEAVADRWPRFAIGGTAALAGTPGLEGLVGEAIAGAVGPVFDAGRRKAEVERRRSRVREELERYASAYLKAVREVETALLRETKIGERIDRQETQLATARRLLAELRHRYGQGVPDYLPVLDALTKVQALERDLLTSRRERFSTRVALHRALGGPMPEANY